jgi:hypothetical protein
MQLDKEYKEVPMIKKAKSKSASKKVAPRKPAKKTAKKKAIKRRSPAKKVVKKKPAKKKTITKKKALKKKSSAKTPKKKTAARTKRGRGKALPLKQFMVSPGPQPRGIPCVEEPASNEEAIGTVVHYYSHLSVAVVQINKGNLKTGDTVHIKGHNTDFVQKVESMEYEHVHVDQTSAGQIVGLKVKDHAREHDILFLVK